MRRSSRTLAQMDFRPASFKMHIVHVRVHQLDAVPLSVSGIRCKAVTRSLSEVESFALIRHDDGYFVAGFAPAPDVYFLRWIFLIAVHDSISQSFAERQLDIELRSRNTLRSFNQPHQAVNQR